MSNSKEFPCSKFVKQADPEVAELIQRETERLKNGIQLIPSENFMSRSVLETTGSILSNKYSEGYPGKRYYEGNEIIDLVENLAIQRAKKLFNAEHANVQPLSGAPANMAAYEALLSDGDTVMSMNLAQGGHLTHGASVNFSGRKYHFVHYNVSHNTHLIDYDQLAKDAKLVRPKLIVAGATAYPRIIYFDKFKEVADSICAKLLVDMSHIAGLVVGKAHPDPVCCSDVVTSTTHKTLRGPRGALILCREEYAKNIDVAIFPTTQAGPHENTIAAKAVAFKEASEPDYMKYIEQIILNAKALAEELLRLGYDLVSGGTDNHLMIIDLSKKNITGKDASAALDKANICANKNLVPYDTKSPFVTSGIRIGTPAMTTRGLKEKDMVQIARWIDRGIKGMDSSSEIEGLKSEIKEYLSQFPLYDFV
ncbi:MAG: serine hydroxymethyltransferase [Desulfobacterales bacterium]|nr:serine hydroxymethyltransferase [Desulfobacterales bacterium]